MSVTPSFFDVLAVRPMLGRGFKPEPEYSRGDDEAVLSYGAWQRLFGGRRDVVGATLTLSGAGGDDVYTVVGVMPQAFAFGEPVDVWRQQVVDSGLSRRLRGWRYDRVIGRLTQGTTIAQAQSELDLVSARLAAETPVASAGWTARVESLHHTIVGNFGRATWLMFAAVVVVLLVACLNVGSLFMARAAARERETAVRISLGAGSWRLVHLWLAEASMVCAAGAVLGVVLASWGVAALKAAAPAGIPRLDAVAIDAPVLALASGAMLVAVIAFVAVPLRRTMRSDWSQRLRSRSDNGVDGRGRRTVHASLTAAQCAGAAALVVLGVMFGRSFVKLASYELGWSAQDVVSLEAAPRMPRDLQRPWFARADWAERLVAALNAHPLVDAAAVTTQVPLTPAPTRYTLARGLGKNSSDEGRWSSIRHAVSSGYFELLGMRLVEGRPFGTEDWFTEAQMTDNAVRPARGTAIVSLRTARTLWPGESAVGRAIWLPDNDNVVWREVVGVVDDLQFTTVGETPALHVFVPWMQDSAAARIFVLVKTSGDAASALTAARDLVQATAPGSAVDEVLSLEALVSRATAQPRFTSRVVALFAFLGLLLAAVGIYGTLSYLVNRRTQEIGIRVALGASRRVVFADVIWRGMLPALAGGIVGLVAATGAARAVRALLFDIEPADPVSLVAGAAMLLAVALAAAVIPAHRAASVDPVHALRAD